MTLTLQTFIWLDQLVVQLIKDMLSVSEVTSWQIVPSLHSKYRALRCNISHVEDGSVEHSDISNYILTSVAR